MRGRAQNRDHINSKISKNRSFSDFGMDLVEKFAI